MLAVVCASARSCPAATVVVALYWVGLDVGEAVRLAGGIDAPGDVLRLEGLRARVHLQVLHDSRVDRADHQPRDDQERGPDERQAPAADRRGQDEQHRDEGGDAGQDDATRDRRVDIRVAGSGDRRRGADRRLVGQRGVLVEPDAHRLQREVHGRGQGELDAGGAGDPHLATRDPDAAVEVIGGQRRESRDDDDGRGVGDDAVVERQLVDVERDVESELFVFRAEARSVQELQHGRPARRGRDAHEDAEHDRDAVHRQAAQGLDHLLVAVELRVELRVDRPSTERDEDAHPDQQAHGQEPDPEHHDGREPLRRQHLEEAGLVVPEHVGVEAGEDEEGDHQHGEHGGRDRERRARTAARGGSLGTGGTGRRHPTILGSPAGRTRGVRCWRNRRDQPAEQVGNDPVPLPAAMALTAAKESASVFTATTLIPLGTCPTTSSQLDCGARNHVAPSSRAPYIF